MFANVFLKSLRDQRRAVIGWSIGIVLLVLLESAMWPSIRNMPDLNEFLANYPESMRKLFNLESFGTGSGFINVELFSTMLPVLFIVFGIGRGARAVAVSPLPGPSGNVEFFLWLRAGEPTIGVADIEAEVERSARLGVAGEKVDP